MVSLEILDIKTLLGENSYTETAMLSVINSDISDTKIFIAANQMLSSVVNKFLGARQEGH